MEREFKIDRISHIETSDGTVIKYACKTCDDEGPEMKLNINFSSVVGREYLDKIGRALGDRFRVEFAPISTQTELE